MVERRDGMLRVFWPHNLSRTTAPSVIVGWRNSELDLFVITALEDVEVRSVESALKMGTLFRNSQYPVPRIFQLCEKSTMDILGTLNHPSPTQDLNPGTISAFTMAGSKKPYIYCPGNTEVSVQVVLFDPPNALQLQYMSLEPISLAFSRDHASSRRPVLAAPDEIEAEQQMERQRIAHLATKLQFHTVLRHRTTQKEAALTAILRQINCVQEVADLLQKNAPLLGPRRKRSMSVSERVVESAQSLYTFAAWTVWSLFMAYVFPTLLQLFKIAIIGHRILAEAILRILEWPLPLQKLQLPERRGRSDGRIALKDVSACCQQVHLRLQQFSYYPTQFSLLRRRHATWSSFPSTNSDYIRFYNSLWLVANDVIMGIALGSYVSDNAQATSRFLEAVLNEYTVEGLKRMIRWLMSYPGGLKLNTELAAFLGDLFLWVIQYWSSTTLSLILPRLPTVVYFIGFSSFAGASMPIAILSDLVSLLTIHIYSFYVASARIFNWQLTIIVSLFHLFRGKKRNVLRNRIDNCDYDLDQLLLGTILFTLLFFLLPTVVVFYLTFASARMAIISLKATLDSCLACLNHFPLFALMLRFKDSKRLPGGVHFQLLDIDQFRLASQSDEGVDLHGPGASGDQDPEKDDEEESNEKTQSPPIVAYIQLLSTPLSLGQIFEQYFQLWTRIRSHYLSPWVLFRLLTGRFVPPLGRSEMYGLQYSALPRERATISEVWQSLNETLDVQTGKGPARSHTQPETSGIHKDDFSQGWR